MNTHRGGFFLVEAFPWGLAISSWRPSAPTPPSSCIVPVLSASVARFRVQPICSLWSDYASTAVHSGSLTIHGFDLGVDDIIQKYVVFVDDLRSLLRLLLRTKPITRQTKVLSLFVHFIRMLRCRLPSPRWPNPYKLKLTLPKHLFSSTQNPAVTKAFCVISMKSGISRKSGREISNLYSFFTAGVDFRDISIRQTGIHSRIAHRSWRRVELRLL